MIMLRPRRRVDETLDVLAAHGVAGLTGILFIGFVAQKALERRRRRPASTATPAQLGEQALAALAAPAYAFAATFALLKLIGAGHAAARDRATRRRSGMDIVSHGEEAYATGEGAILVALGDRSQRSEFDEIGRTGVLVSATASPPAGG